MPAPASHAQEYSRLLQSLHVFIAALREDQLNQRAALSILAHLHYLAEAPDVDADLSDCCSALVHEWQWLKEGKPA